jgi:hypothetical protein
MNYNDIFKNEQTTSLLSGLSSFVPGGAFFSSVVQPGGFDNLIDSIGLGSLMGQTSKEDFLKDGEKKIKIIFSNFFPLNPISAESQINGIIYHLYFLKTHYSINLKNSTSARSKEGNKSSLNDVSEAINLFTLSIPKLGFNVVKTTKSTVFKKSNNLLNWFSDSDKNGTIPFYKVSGVKNIDAVKNATAENVFKIPVTSNNTSENNFSAKNVLIVGSIITAVFWTKIKKILK